MRISVVADVANVMQEHAFTYFLGRRLGGSARRLVFVQTVLDGAHVKIHVDANALIQFIQGHALCLHICKTLASLEGSNARVGIRDLQYEDVSLMEVRPCGFADEHETVLSCTSPVKAKAGRTSSSG